MNGKKDGRKDTQMDQGEEKMMIRWKERSDVAMIDEWMIEGRKER